jgi:hypothetical protein
MTILDGDTVDMKYRLDSAKLDTKRRFGASAMSATADRWPTANPARSASLQSLPAWAIERARGMRMKAQEPPESTDDAARLR